MSLIYGIPLIVVLVAAWFIARRVVAQARQREALKRRQRRARSARSRNSDTASLRSDMRATDSPATIIDTIQQRARAPTSGPASDTRKRDRDR